MLSLLPILFACNSADQTFSATNDNIVTEQGSAKMEWSPSELVITDVEPEITFSGVVSISSVGDNNLVIDKVDITNSANGIFYIDTSSTQDITLAPDSQPRDFVVIVLTPDEELYQGEVRVKSNDADILDLRIPICTFPVGYEGETSCSSGETSEEDTAEETEDTGS